MCRLAHKRTPPLKAGPASFKRLLGSAALKGLHERHIGRREGKESSEYRKVLGAMVCAWTRSDPNAPSTLFNGSDVPPSECEGIDKEVFVGEDKGTVPRGVPE